MGMDSTAPVLYPHQYLLLAHIMRYLGNRAVKQPGQPGQTEQVEQAGHLGKEGTYVLRKGNDG